MLYPSMNQLLKNVPSRYLLVNVTAKRARQISDDVDKKDNAICEKPVRSAINDIAEGRLCAKLKDE